MKTLTIIWATAIISGVLAVGYVNSSINALVAKTASPSQGLRTQSIDHNARVYPSVNLQGGKITTAGALSGAPVKLQATARPQVQVGGNGADYEIQPAVGYGALGWTMQ